ncbi:MAG: hypothetical protein J6U64_04580, partial [Alphaproteobacteria bacterium]|nr:hypothetical protein [Alphaproteobacteria bacterium]
MKKTTLFLLTTCALAGCYSAPEMVENKYRGYYSDSSVCGASTDYQHEELRACIERRLKEEDKNKKTVSIVPLENGTSMIIPKVPGDEILKDTSLIYEVVDIRDKSAVQDDYDEEVKTEPA